MNRYLIIEVLICLVIEFLLLIIEAFACCILEGLVFLVIKVPVSRGLDISGKEYLPLYRGWNKR